MSESIWDIARSVWRAEVTADMQNEQRRQQELAWRQVSARIQLTGEQIEDSRNNQGAFTQAYANEQQRVRDDWTRYMMQQAGISDIAYKKCIDPDLELDEGL